MRREDECQRETVQVGGRRIWPPYVPVVLKAKCHRLPVKDHRSTDTCAHWNSPSVVTFGIPIRGNCWRTSDGPTFAEIKVHEVLKRKQIRARRTIRVRYW